MANELEIAGRRVAIGKLDRMLFPQAGVTRARLLDYYVRVADAMLPHLRERLLLHMHRYPEGVEGPRFWQKGCPEHKPAWVPTAPVWSRDKHATIDYCVINELGALLWAVNKVARRLRDMMASLGARAFAKTSGSKGLQVYVPLNDDTITESRPSPCRARSPRCSSPRRRTASSRGRRRGRPERRARRGARAHRRRGRPLRPGARAASGRARARLKGAVELRGARRRQGRG